MPSFQILTILCLISSINANIKNCDVRSLLKQRSVSLSPIVKGSDVHLKLNLIAPRQITDATATYSTRYNYFPAFSYSEPVSQIEHGIFNRTLKYPIPFYTFGNIQVKIQWTSPTNGNLLCIEIEEDI
jgi:hypothetical protein